MPIPRILLLSRSAIESNHPDLQAFLSTIPVDMCIAQCDEDKEAALKVSPVVGTFTNTTAIVADFPGCLVINDDGSVGAIVLPEVPAAEEQPLIQLI